MAGIESAAAGEGAKTVIAAMAAVFANIDGNLLS